MGGAFTLSHSGNRITTVRGENYVAVLDGGTYEPKTRIIVRNGQGMTIFSPDGKYDYVCSSFTPETDVISVVDHQIVGKVVQASPFCPNIAADGVSLPRWMLPGSLLSAGSVTETVFEYRSAE